MPTLHLLHIHREWVFRNGRFSLVQKAEIKMLKPSPLMTTRDTLYFAGSSTSDVFRASTAAGDNGMNVVPS